MPTNPTLPTYQDILERVKAQEWGHEWQPMGDGSWELCKLCGSGCSSDGQVCEPCPVRIAQAIQAAMVEALRRAEQMGAYIEVKEAADALEKGLTK